MKKKLIIIIITLICLMGCNKSESNKFDLGDEYYNKNTFTEADANKIKELQKNKSSYIIYT